MKKLIVPFVMLLSSIGLPLVPAVAAAQDCGRPAVQVVAPPVAHGPRDFRGARFERGRDGGARFERGQDRGRGRDDGRDMRRGGWDRAGHGRFDGRRAGR